jgi:hypothetical protein
LFIFIIATLLLGYVLLAIIALLHVAKDLLARAFSPVPSYSESEQDLDADLPEASQATHIASRDTLLEGEYSQ